MPHRPNLQQRGGPVTWEARHGDASFRRRLLQHGAQRMEVLTESGRQPALQQLFPIVHAAKHDGDVEGAVITLLPRLEQLAQLTDVRARLGDRAPNHLAFPERGQPLRASVLQRCGDLRAHAHAHRVPDKQEPDRRTAHAPAGMPVPLTFRLVRRDVGAPEVHRLGHARAGDAEDSARGKARRAPREEELPREETHGGAKVCLAAAFVA
mmetsp:Transcript_113467/g.326227  ORF Transcript_113467/g.326227 Transcript_113467/m.326227 type:complete len:209 (-) Transcript_113467:2-628(-)